PCLFLIPSYLRRLTRRVGCGGSPRLIRWVTAICNSDTGPAIPRRSKTSSSERHPKEPEYGRRRRGCCDRLVPFCPRPHRKRARQARQESRDPRSQRGNNDRYQRIHEPILQGGRQSARESLYAAAF